MDLAEITAKARVLLEALPYIQDFRGSIFVVKYGGSFMDDPDPVIRARVAYDIAFFAAVGINVVVVHGGGKAITKAMEASGLSASFVNGLRVTDEATMAVVKQDAQRGGEQGSVRRDRHGQGPAEEHAGRHRARLPEARHR